MYLKHHINIDKTRVSTPRSIKASVWQHHAGEKRVKHQGSNGVGKYETSYQCSGEKKCISGVASAMYGDRHVAKKKTA